MPPDPEPPVPILARFFVLTGIIRITFDKPLQPGSFTDRDWFARWANRERAIGLVIVLAGSPTVCTINTTLSPADVGPNIVQYTAGSAELIGQNGIPVAPFTEPLVAG